jgi:hypothetical protein
MRRRRRQRERIFHAQFELPGGNPSQHVASAFLQAGAVSRVVIARCGRVRNSESLALRSAGSKGGTGPLDRPYSTRYPKEVERVTGTLLLPFIPQKPACPYHATASGILLFLQAT